MPYKIQACGQTDIGLVRQNNEDYWAQIPEDSLFILADGMGGHKAGEIASSEAVTKFCQLIKEQDSKEFQKKNMGELQDLLEEVFQKVNGSIFSLSCQNEKWRGMGTTLSCLLIRDQGIICTYVGDSRIYRQRDHHLEQLTQDHSLLREMMDLGQIDENQSERFLYRNILTRAIGTEPIVESSVYIDNVLSNDIYLMCSDGLTDLLSKSEIEEIINQVENIQEAAKKLVKVAKHKGGYDNITVILIKVQDK